MRASFAGSEASVLKTQESLGDNSPVTLPSLFSVITPIGYPFLGSVRVLKRARIQKRLDGGSIAMNNNVNTRY